MSKFSPIYTQIQHRFMSILKIVYPNDQRLRQPAEKVTTFDATLSQLAADMLETMQLYDGVGLAGPQVGVMQRIFVVEIPTTPQGEEQKPHPQSGQTHVIVNPEIVDIAPESAEGLEGCLSLPTWYGAIERPEWVEIKAHDLQGRAFHLKVDDLLSRAFQHEIDHLNGVMFTERIADPDKLWQTLPE